MMRQWNTFGDHVTLVHSNNYDAQKALWKQVCVVRA
jgi:hypothetical protein